MATRFEIVLYGDDAMRLRAAGEEALAEVEALDRQLSLYRPESDISWINAKAHRKPVKVEPRLFRLLRTASELSRATDGAFDITIAPLVRAWGLAGGEGRIPSEPEIAEALERVGMHRVHLDEADFTVQFEHDGMEIDLGAIGKGYAVERAIETLRDNGIASALIHGGTSTIYGLGSPPRADSWRVAVTSTLPSLPRRGRGWAAVASTLPSLPRRGRGRLGHSIQDCDRTTEIPKHHVVALRDSSLSVSAVRGKSFTAAGTEYGHVIDPRTGRPSNRAALAAVWGPSAVESDALSTALLVLGEPGLTILGKGFADCRGLVIAPEVGH